MGQEVFLNRLQGFPFLIPTGRVMHTCGLVLERWAEKLDSPQGIMTFENTKGFVQFDASGKRA